VQGLLFLEKEYGSESPPLLPPDTEVEVNVEIFRLLRVSRSRQEMTLQQLPMTNALLSNASVILPQLKKLALHRVTLDLSLLLPASNLSSLTLDRVHLDESKISFSRFLQRHSRLQVLALAPEAVDGAGNLRLSLAEFPPSLQSLSLSAHVHLKASNPNPSSHLFPDLSTFCCLGCHMDPEALNQLRAVIPSLKTLVLLGKTSAEVDLRRFHTLPRLRSLYVESGPETVTHWQLKGRDWERRDVDHRRKETLAYDCSGQADFWTSEEEWRSLRRLTSFEKEAFNSGKYIFGSKGEAFDGIPTEIQPELESISLSALQVSPKVRY
jgi:hypothetical protein